MLSGAFKLVEAPVGTGGGVPVTFDVPLVVVGGGFIDVSVLSFKNGS